MARPRAQDFDAKRGQILDSAAEVFATEGMDRASMALIARQAGVSKALLYHYYPGKDALIFEIIATHLEAVDAAVAKADDPSLPHPARLERLVAAVLETYEGADNRHKVQLNAGPVLTPAQQAAIRDIERRIVAHFTRALAAARPDLPPHLLMPVTMSLFGMMNWVYMWFRDGGPVTRRDYAALAAQLMLGGLPAVAEPGG